MLRAARRASSLVVTALGAGLCACAAPLQLNDMQVIATHNSYKRHIDPAIMAPLAAHVPGLARQLDYGHEPLAQQLERGVRGFELDVYLDPRGGRFAQPAVLAGLRAAGLALTEPYDPDGELRMPGFKVLHRADVDFFSSCLTLQRCLQALRTWSSAHPSHVPIVVTMNVKDPLPGAPVPPGEPSLDAEAWDALDREIVRGIGRQRLFTPDDLRGEHDSPCDAALSEAWPELDDARGKLLFVLDESAEKIASYAAGHPALRGRMLFVNALEGRAESAVRILNEPLEQRAYIAELVAQGYLVRTRADADTEEGRSGDERRRDAALGSGAQLISTDFVVPDPRFGSGYAVQLPGGGVARCNPVRQPACRIEE
jgi:hypothetical protein